MSQIHSQNYKLEKRKGEKEESGPLFFPIKQECGSPRLWTSFSEVKYISSQRQLPGKKETRYHHFSLLVQKIPWVN